MYYITSFVDSRICRGYPPFTGSSFLKMSSIMKLLGHGRLSKLPRGLLKAENRGQEDKLCLTAFEWLLLERNISRTRPMHREDNNFLFYSHVLQPFPSSSLKQGGPNWCHVYLNTVLLTLIASSCLPNFLLGSLIWLVKGILVYKRSDQNNWNIRGQVWCSNVISTKMSV